MGATEQWEGMVRARLAEFERLGSEAPSTGSFWDARADRFARRFPLAHEADPIARRVRDTLDPEATLLDVGAGAGRFTVPCAAWAREVIAIDPSTQMLARLRQQAEHAGADNITCVQASWPDVAGDADVALCSYVLPLVEDVGPFLRRLDEAAQRRVLVVLSGTTPGILQEPFWRHFHRRQPPPAPTYLDALEVLDELGFDAAVDVFEIRSTSMYADLDEAVAEYRSQLYLTADHDHELRGLLADWLVADTDRLRPPFETSPVALVSWVPESAS